MGPRPGRYPKRRTGGGVQQDRGRRPNSSPRSIEKPSEGAYPEAKRNSRHSTYIRSARSRSSLAGPSAAKSRGKSSQKCAGNLANSRGFVSKFRKPLKYWRFGKPTKPGTSRGGNSQNNKRDRGFSLES